jgi:uncharacterized membrane protein ArfB
MGFFLQWMWCLLAFLLGSLLAWLLATASLTFTSADDAMSDLADSGEADR